MSRTSGEKARAAIQKRNRTLRRAKDRARLAEIKNPGAAESTEKTEERTPRSSRK